MSLSEKGFCCPLLHFYEYCNEQILKLHGLSKCWYRKAHLIFINYKSAFILSPFQAFMSIIIFIKYAKESRYFYCHSSNYILPFLFFSIYSYLPSTHKPSYVYNQSTVYNVQCLCWFCLHRLQWWHVTTYIYSSKVFNLSIFFSPSLLLHSRGKYCTIYFPIFRPIRQLHSTNWFVFDNLQMNLHSKDFRFPASWVWRFVVFPLF